MKPTKHKNLLETICTEAGCEYLSDLHIRPLFRNEVHLPSPSDYTLEEWTYAVNYITGGSRKFHSAREAVGYLVDFWSESGFKRITINKEE